MIDASFILEPARDVLALDMWEGDPPDVAARMVQVEPRRWWLIDAGAAGEALTDLVAGRGTVTPIGGGMVRATIAGPGWRELLTVSGLFDVEDPAFTNGRVASTIIHHVAVRIVVTGTSSCEIYCAASYAATLRELWQGASKGG